MKDILKNSVIQVNEKGPEGWIGCLMQVSELKESGVLAWVKIPFQGDAFLRVKFEQFDIIGQATMEPNDDEEEQE